MLVARSKATLRRVLERLRGGELTPARWAGSVALGLFVGIQPVYGFHLPICASLAWAFRLDVFVTYAAANISIPPMIPLLLYGGLQLGALALTGSLRELSLAELHRGSLLATGAQLVVDSILLGLLAAVLGGALAYVMAQWFGRRRTPPDAEGQRLAAAIEATNRHYRKVPPAHRYYVASKLRLDPLTRELFQLAEAGIVRGRLLDVGAGRGQFSGLLMELGVVSEVIGFDHDRDKVAAAELALAQHRIPAHFEAGDLRSPDLPQADTILLLDVLHYLSTLEQDAVLEHVVVALRPGGHVLLRETNRGQGQGARWAAFLERLARLLRINRGERLVFRSPEDYAQTLRGFGLTVEVNPGRGTLDNVLLVAHSRPLA
ncbi:MAG TPA: DUF2062 domain-containing protein [Polyangiaceae bacterium]|nr:DUF2062 domain-containing protein [Polyangiaceae bacterium]